MRSGKRATAWGKRCAAALLLLLMAATAVAQSPYEPLSQDKGAAGLTQMLRRLRTTARLMHTIAHPDDEDGGMLTLESRGKGVTALQLTLNRGEGGQNRTGSNLLDELGILRTLELLAADRYYAVEQRFTRVADFGFSKSAEETFAKWHGHDIALADMVRVIRSFRPDVIVSRFQGTRRDGHGHHEAAGILTREAFRAAADPSRFPEQIREGLQPWQAKKLYIDNVRPPEESTLKLDTGVEDTALGTSYAQFAMQGLKRQLSQGAGDWQFRPGPHVSYYRLVDSVLAKSDKPETDFFDGLDTSLPGLAARLNEEEKKLPFLAPALRETAANIEQASAAAEKQPSAAALPVLTGLRSLRDLIGKVERSSLSAAARTDLLTQLKTKQRQLEEAALLALGLELRAVTVESGEFIAVPGQAVTVAVTLRNQGPFAVEPGNVELEAPAGSVVQSEGRLRRQEPGQSGDLKFHVMVSPEAKVTRPYWHRSDPEKETVYAVDEPQYATLPLPPPPFRVRASYRVNELEGEMDAVVMVRSGSPPKERPLPVLPAFAVTVNPPSSVVNIQPGAKKSDTPEGAVRCEECELKSGVTAVVRKNFAPPAEASFNLQLPAAWKSKAPSQSLKMRDPGDYQTGINFRREALQEGKYAVSEYVQFQGRQYRDGYNIVARDDIGAFYFYRPATQTISAVNVKLPGAVKVGYVMGAGDEIPSVLEQIGLEVEEITPEELAGGDLNRFGTIVLGIRAYDAREDVRKNNRRLINYVANGGTLLVQYNANLSQFNSGSYAPYRAEISRGRVSVEEAPVQVLAPGDALLNWPNKIQAHDFEGWVQERGLYFMGSWDPHFEPLLESHDPGEQPLKGGLLRARFGKGTYIYTGYSFFRQLPAGVPGAIRLFVNLVSAGHEETGGL